MLNSKMGAVWIGGQSIAAAVGTFKLARFPQQAPLEKLLLLRFRRSAPNVSRQKFIASFDKELTTTITVGLFRFKYIYRHTQETE